MTTKKTTKPTTKKTTKPRAAKPAPTITPATLYRTDGTSEQVLPTNGNHFTLEALREYVGGDIELLRSADGGTLMVVNEEGLLRKLPPNEKATNWAMREGASYSVIVGNAVIMNAKQIR
jgi:hypothetical protein